MSNSIEAQRYNNSLQGQGFDDRFNIARGKAGLLPAMNANTIATGQVNANGTKNTGVQINDAIGAGAQAWGKFNDKKTGTPSTGSVDTPEDTIQLEEDESLNKDDD